ncbi:MAG: NAD-dependent epimerase/dehydratase family protein [Candidatus Aenigmarchaeota archaeon]|nr:NAD-dependent epimerase/dehydratase family protein [Candidatus Aenigmarchaeota archaeon]
MKKLLVSGASGFIGSNLSRLLKDKYNVIGLVRDASKIENEIGSFQIDLTKQIENLPNADYLVHLAALIRLEPPQTDEDLYKVNAIGTFNLLSAAKKSGIDKIIYISTVGIYGNREFNSKEEDKPNPSNTYSSTKLIGEEICKIFAENFNFKVIVLRFSGVYGGGRTRGVIYNSLSQAMKNEDIVIENTENSTWDPVYVKDVVKSISKSLDYLDEMDGNFMIFNIGLGHPITIKKITDEIVSITNSKSKVSFLGRAPDEHFSMDITRARALLEFEPMSIEESLRDFYEELKHD